MRVLIGGIVAGIVIFAWGAVSHMVLPLGTMGMQSLPGENAVVATLKEAIPEPGLYFFPGMEIGRKLTPEEEKAWQAKYTAGPTGLLVYHPQGQQPMAMNQLLTEVVSNIAGALVAAIVLTQIAGGFGARVMVVTLTGLFGWISISVSQWNWYGFPGSFVLAEGIDQVVGALLGGLVLAGIVKRAQA